MARITYTGAQLDAAIRKVKSGFFDVSNVEHMQVMLDSARKSSTQ